MPLKKPIRPISPVLVTANEKKECPEYRCHKGVYSEWTGVGSDYNDTVCSTCGGTGYLDGEVVNEIAIRRHKNEMRQYNNVLEIQKVLRTIKLTKKQRQALNDYGVDNYLKETS